MMAMVIKAHAKQKMADTTVGDWITTFKDDKRAAKHNEPSNKNSLLPDVISKVLKNYLSSSTGDNGMTGGNPSNNKDDTNPAALPNSSWPFPFVPSVWDQRLSGLLHDYNMHCPVAWSDDILSRRGSPRGVYSRV